QRSLALPLFGIAALRIIIFVTCVWVRAADERPASTRALPWSFQPMRAVTLPNVKDQSRVRSPIDAFILAELEKNKLKPAPAAEKLTLLRRAYFDLVGLPPPLEVLETFVNDNRSDAFPRLIDRLLASPHYGERWGRHWLDVARYADTGGSEADLVYAEAWRYRDYVIRSFNSDKPFDRFIREQIAGDEFWPDNPDAVIATGLYAIGPVLEESAMVSNQLEYECLTDAMD